MNSRREASPLHIGLVGLTSEKRESEGSDSGHGADSLFNEVFDDKSFLHNSGEHRSSSQFFFTSSHVRVI